MDNLESSTSRTKLVDMTFHYVREQVQRRVIEINKVTTSAQLADGLTKVACGVGLENILNGLGLSITA